MTRGSPKLLQTPAKTTSGSSEGWHQDAKSWLNHWGIQEDVILQNIDNIKNIITSKFKENLWCNKELEDKRKLRYYKEVVNPNLEDQKYLSVLTSAKKKINIAKI
jgi:hypothetical protein